MHITHLRPAAAQHIRSKERTNEKETQKNMYSARKYNITQTTKNVKPDHKKNLTKHKTYIIILL